MDTLLRQRFEPIVPEYRRAPRDLATTMPVLALAVVAWLVMSGWSVMLVSTGIVSAGLLPPNIPEPLVFAFAIGLQTCVSLLGVLTPCFFRPLRPVPPLVWVFVFAVCLVITGFETFHVVFIQMKASVGAGLEQVEEAELTRLHQGITDVSRQIPALFQAKLDGFLELAADAKAGRDRTGDAHCGPICQHNFDLYHAAKERFRELAVNTVPPAGSGGGDLRSRLIDLHHRFDNLKAREASFADFYKFVDQSSPPKMISVAVSRLEAALAAKEAEHSGIATIDAKTLALARTNEAFVHIANGDLPRADVVLPLAYGVLPALAITILGIYIRVAAEARRRPRVAIDLERDLVAEQEAASKLRRLVQLRHANFRNWLRAAMRRWDKGDPSTI